MSIANPTLLKVFETADLKRAIETQDKTLLLEALNQRWEMGDVPTVGGVPAVVVAAKRQWWHAISLLCMHTENGMELLTTWIDENGENLWHWLAAARGEWEARALLSESSILLIENKKGELPTWGWTTPDWAEVWVRLIPPVVWRGVKTHVDATGGCVVEHWLKKRLWALAYWGVSRGLLTSDAAVRERCLKHLEKAPGAWVESFAGIGLGRVWV
jgi:hypothetical protein